MKVSELYEKIKDLDSTLYMVHHGSYSGLIRKCKVVGKFAVLSGDFYPNYNMEDNEVIDFLRDLSEDTNTCDYEVVYAVPSCGTFRVLDAAQHHYDYSADGDDVYDAVDIDCEDEPLCGGKDSDIEEYFKNKVDPDDYEDFFESTLKKENKLNEDIDAVYSAACYRAERVISSFIKDFGKEMTERAFEKALN